MSIQSKTQPEPIESIATIPGVQIREREPMAQHVSMGVGGPARWFVVIEEMDALEPVCAALRAGELPWMVLGGGSNTIFADEGYEGVVLSLGRGFRAINEGPGPHQLTAGAAAPLSAIMNFARRAGLTGMEWAAGVPGVLGGALAGNAGTALGDTCSSVEAVEVIDATGRRLQRNRGSFDYGYRHSDLCHDVILGATLGLRPDDPAAIQQRVEAGLAKRREQPLGKRSSGCMFKNPPGDSAGRLIDRAGLKGLRIGGAEVAAEHANFVINDGTATARDVRELTQTIRRRVRERWGVKLELEIRIVMLDSGKDLS